MLIKNAEPTSSITLTGARMSKCALIIDEGATDEQLGQIGLALVGIEGARSWWIGDYGVCLTGRKGEHYTTGRAEALGIDAGTFRIYVGVSRFFDPLTRIYDSLSFAHYRAAQEGADGDVQRAQEWLEKAQEQGLTVSQLRKAINTSKATSVNDDERAEQNEFSFMDKADKWATTKKDTLKEIDAETAKNLLDVRWFGVVQMIDGLRAIVKGAI